MIDRPYRYEHAIPGVALCDFCGDELTTEHVVLTTGPMVREESDGRVSDLPTTWATCPSCAGRLRSGETERIVARNILDAIDDGQFDDDEQGIERELEQLRSFYRTLVEQLELE